MTKARDLANLISGGFTEADIPNLSASKITSGTFADARLSQSSVQQYASTFDDNKIVNDISTLGLRVHTQENLNASNTNSASFDVFQDSSGITNLTNTLRNASEYIDTTSTSSSNTSMTLGWNTSTSASNASSLVSGVALRINDSDFSSGNESNFSIGDGNGGYSDLQFARITMDFATSNHSPSSGSFWQDGGSDVNWKNTYGSGRFNVIYEIKQGSYTGFTPNGTASYVGRNGGGSITDVKIYGLASSGGTLVELGHPQNGGNMSHGTTYSVSISNSTSYPYIVLSFYMSGSNHIGYDKFGLVGTAQATTSSTSATGSFEGATITAGASTSKMGAVITYQDNGSSNNVLNTDIVLQLSADGGSNYSTATLTALPDFATGIKMAKVNDLSVTAGTSLKYKLSFANQASGSKEARIRGVSLQY
jgi:hypothetical protein